MTNIDDFEKTIRRDQNLKRIAFAVVFLMIVFQWMTEVDRSPGSWIPVVMLLLLASEIQSGRRLLQLTELLRRQSREADDAATT